MEILVKGGQLLLSLSILVVLHELGHFIPAKLFKTKVEKFYLFFNPGFSIFKVQKGETEYGIGWLPLGGYVKIAGMIDESMDKTQLEKEPEPWEFRSKPAWQRLIIMLGGVTVNVILGVIIFSMVAFVWGDNKVQSYPEGMYIHPMLEEYGLKTGDEVIEIEGKLVKDYRWLNEEVLFFGGRSLKVQEKDGSIKQINLPEDIDYKAISFGAKKGFSLFDLPLPFVVDSVIIGKPAYEANLQEGDSIIAINGETPAYFQDLSYALAVSDKPVNLTYKRKDSIIATTITPVEDDGRKIIGVMTSTNVKKRFDFVHINYGLGESVVEGVSGAARKLAGNVISMKFLFTKAGISQVGGFISIGDMYAPTWDWHSFWYITGFLSLVLAFMNILPIPALDGGHALFTIYEMITGKKPGKKFLEYAQMVGMVILLSLLLLVNGKDVIQKLF